MLIQSILNLLVFIPAGYFFKAVSRTKTAIAAICIAVAIELIQYMLIVGFCDTFDMLLYIAGIIIGRAIFAKVRIRFKGRSEEV